METNALVGMGATKVVGSDRYAYTVVEVCSPKRLMVQKDIAVCVDYENQRYEYHPDPDGPKRMIFLRKDGKWGAVGEEGKGTFFSIGARNEYRDRSF